MGKTFSVPTTVSKLAERWDFTEKKKKKHFNARKNCIKRKQHREKTHNFINLARHIASERNECSGNIRTQNWLKQ